MLEFLLEKNEQDRQLALEDAYNLQDACSRLAHETHVKTFSQILSGEVCVCVCVYCTHIWVFARRIS